MGPDESDVGDGGVRERYEGLGWETFDVTDNIDIDGDLFGPLLDMDYDDALDKELMATTSSPSNIAMTRGPTPELSVTPLPNALGSAGQERGRDSGENNGTSGTSWHQALEESSSPSSVSVGLESPKVSLKLPYCTFYQGRPFRLAQTRKPCGSPQPPPVNRAFSAPNAEDGPFGGVTKSRTSQGESGAKQLGISRKRKTPVGHLSPANEDCPHQQAKFAKIARDKARRHVYQELEPSSMGAERSGRVTMLSCERQLRSNPIAPSMAEQVSNRIMLQKIEARRGAFEDNRMEQCRPSHGVPSRQHHQQLQQQQLQKNQFGGVKTPMKPSISAALTPSPPSRIPRSPLLNRPVHTLPFLSVAAAAAAPKAVSSTTSRRPSFPPLEGRDPNVEVSTTDENAAGGCSFVHEMENILFAWDPSEVKHQQQQKVYRQEFHKPIAGTMPLPLSNMGQQQQQTMERFCGNAVRNRNGLYRPASVYPGELGLHQEQRLFHQQQKLELEQMQRVHEQQIQQNHLRGVKTPMSSRKPLGSAALTSSPPVKAFCCIPISPLRGPPGQGLPFRTAVSTEKAATTGGRGASSTNEAQNLHTPPRRPSFPPL